jgi:integrase
VSITRTLVETHRRLEIGRPKTAAGTRTLDLPEPLRDELAAYVERSGLTDPDALLFADSFGGPLRRSNFRRRVFAPAAKTAGVEGLTFHGLRHSAATTWMAAGADVRTVQHLLGHSDPRLVLRLYAHVANDAVKRGAEIASRHYWEDGTTGHDSPDVP